MREFRIGVDVAVGMRPFDHGDILIDQSGRRWMLKCQGQWNAYAEDEPRQVHDEIVGIKSHSELCYVLNKNLP